MNIIISVTNNCTSYARNQLLDLSHGGKPMKCEFYFQETIIIIELALKYMAILYNCNTLKKN